MGPSFPRGELEVWHTAPSPSGGTAESWETAGVNPITLHECRHTFAGTMLAAGVDRGEVMRQMGHAGTAILDRYTHALPGSIEEAGRRLQAFIDYERIEAAG